MAVGIGYMILSKLAPDHSRYGLGWQENMVRMKLQALGSVKVCCCRSSQSPTHAQTVTVEKIPDLL
jgi:hypothetical protein